MQRQIRGHALNHEFERDGNDLGDLSCFVAIMREKPSGIDQLLTRLRVSKTEDSRLEDVDLSDETGYVDRAEISLVTPLVFYKVNAEDQAGNEPDRRY